MRRAAAAPWRASAPPFVGREHEVEALLDAWSRALDGEGRLLLVTGEPGIGKTRIVDEMLRLGTAERAQSDVRRVRCRPADDTPAYWPWTQIVESYPADAAELDDVRGQLAGRVGRLDRVRLFRSVDAFLEERALARTQVLVLDDLQWADPDSVTLLDYLAPGLADRALLVIATVRDIDRTDAAMARIARLARHRCVWRIPLRGWSVAEVGRHLESVTGAPLDAAALANLHRLTAGNPYFVTEIGRDFGTRSLGRLGEPDATIAVPARVEQMIEQRLQSLSPAAREVLETAAIIGSEVSLPLLGRALPDGRTPMATIDWAIAHHVLAPGERAAEVVFVHELVASVLRSGLSPWRRATLHARVGAALEELRGAHAPEVVAELARHFVEAAMLPGQAERAVRYASQAADQAASQHAWDLAVRHYREALAALDGTRTGPEVSGADLAARARLLLALGAVEQRAGRPEAQATLGEAAALSRRIDEQGASTRASDILACTVLVRLEGTPPVGLADRERAIRDVEEVLARLGAREDGLRARVLALLATLLHSADPARAGGLARDAVALARRIDEPLPLARALEAIHTVLWDQPAADERLAVAGQVLAQARAAGDLGLAASAHFWRCLDLLDLGRVTEAELEVATLADLAQRLREPRRIYLAAKLRTGFALMRGRIDEAEARARAAFELGSRAGIDYALHAYLTVLYQVRFAQGRRDELAEIGRQAAAYLADIPEGLTDEPLMLAWHGQAAEAALGLEEMLRDDFASVLPGMTRLPALYNLVWAAIEVGSSEPCRRLYELLLPDADRNVVFSLGASFGHPIQRVLGLLAARLGRLAEARHHLEVALASARRMGARLELARIQSELATVLLAENPNAHRAEAEAMLRQALAEAGAMGGRELERAILAEHPALAPGGRPEQNAGVPSARVVRAGDGLVIEFAGRRVVMEDSRGLQYITALLARPGREIHACDLVAEVVGEPDVPPERARLRVVQRIRSTSSQLASVHPELAAHLAACLRTGNFCVYLPANDTPVTWEL